MHQGVARSWEISIQIMWSSMLASHATLHIQGTPEHDVCGMLLIGGILKQSRLPVLYSAIYPLFGQRIILVILRNNMAPCNICFYNIEQRLLSAFTCSTECWATPPSCMSLWSLDRPHEPLSNLVRINSISNFF